MLPSPGVPMSELVTQNIDAALTSLSILLATIGWMYSARLQRDLTRRGHTLDFLLAQNTYEKLLRLHDLADQHFVTSSQPTFTSMPESVRELLNLHEFLWSAVRDNTLDRKLVENIVAKQLRFSILRFYHHVRPLIVAYRNQLANPQLMKNFEWYAVRKLHYQRWMRGRALPSAS
jgi:hypothetical protein